MPFKEEKLDKIFATIVDVKMQNTSTMDHSWFLVNTSLAVGKSLQSMENKIKKLNKKVEQLKG